MTITPAETDLAARAAFVSEMLVDNRYGAEFGGWPRAKVCLLYLAVNLRNGKAYLGATKDFAKRHRQHLNHAANGGSTPFSRALREYGENIVFVEVQSFENEPTMEANELAMYEEEEVMISRGALRDPEIGYNVTPGGRAIGTAAANAAWADPEYVRKTMASMPERHAKRRATMARRAAELYGHRKSTRLD